MGEPHPTPRPYNGHPSYEHWNVSLWIGNEEALYSLAQGFAGEVARGRITLVSAVRAMKSCLPARTPDGVRYTLEILKYVLADMVSDMKS